MSGNDAPDPDDAGDTGAGTAQKGSMLAGFFLAWGALIAAWIVMAVVIGVLSTMPGPPAVASAVSVLAGLLPMAAVLGPLVWALVKGRTRTALGVVAAIGSMVALVLLLVAACFGLMAGSNWH